jgi:uncharacterized membrane protein YgdD (TMEM256/DUF423 family)
MPTRYITEKKEGNEEPLSSHGDWVMLVEMTNTLALRIAASTGALAVALGAFGAHGLKTVLVDRQTVGIWEKAVFYHLIHALVLLILALRSPLFKGPWFSFLFGVVLFSGSLYLLALANIRWVGAITPFGGVSLIMGWLWLLLSAAKLGRSEFKL